MKKIFLTLLLSFYIFNLSAQNTKKVTVQLPFLKDKCTITCEEVNGEYIFEGDIIIEPEDVNMINDPRMQGAVAIKENGWGKNRRWKNGVIPYKIQAGHPLRREILQAIEHINSKTNVTVRPYRGENDYVEIINGSGCLSSVGRNGGHQTIILGSGCGLSGAIHEICHTIGLFHEQSRSDRDRYVTIHWENIKHKKEGNFRKLPGNTFDLGPYNYNSIMAKSGRYSSN